MKCVVRACWQAVTISQTKNFMKNKYNFTGVGEGKGEDILGEEWFVKVEEAWQNMSIWWAVRDCMWREIWMIWGTVWEMNLQPVP